MTTFRPLPYTTCLDDIASITVIRIGPGTLIPGWRTPGTTGPVFLLGTGDLPTGTFPIELGLVLDSGTTDLPTVQDWGTGPSMGSLDEAGMNAALHDLALHASTTRQLQVASDDDSGYPECEVDGNGEPVGDPGEDYSAGIVAAVGALVTRFFVWSSRNHPSTQ